MRAYAPTNIVGVSQSLLLSSSYLFLSIDSGVLYFAMFLPFSLSLFGSPLSHFIYSVSLHIVIIIFSLGIMMKPYISIVFFLPLIILFFSCLWMDFVVVALLLICIVLHFHNFNRKLQPIFFSFPPSVEFVSVCVVYFNFKLME